MATSNLSATVNYTPTSSLQPVFGPPVQLLTYADATPSNFVATEITLAAAGTSTTLPVPSAWTHVSQVLIQVLDTVGYCVLNPNATSGAPTIQLAPSGGLFCASFGSGTPSGQVAATPSTWTLKSCDSSGVLANGTAMRVFVYLAGA